MSKVFVGLSGGVDSATSAAILKEQKHDVTGVFIKIWSPEFIECTWEQDRLDALRSAVALGIPFKEIDLSNEYRRLVVDHMVESYQAGETPNPDVMCNTFIKFGVFKEWAFKNGAERIATGHYARVMHNSLRNRYELHQGIDVGKDQSYFLHRLSSQDLSRILFPIGGFTKTEVRARARVCGLPVAHKPDSQGLCFVGDVSMHDFLSRFISVMSGDVIDMRGNVIGQHEGAALYTLGQRHGFTLAPSLAARGPLYIVGTDILENTIRVSENKEDAARLNVRVKDVHWIRGDAPSQAVAQVRYHGVFTNAQIQSNAQGYTIRFQSPQIVAPGQSIVFYEGDECLGGAIATHD